MVTLPMLSSTGPSDMCKLKLFDGHLLHAKDHRWLEAFLGQMLRNAIMEGSGRDSRGQ